MSPDAAMILGSLIISAMSVLALGIYNGLEKIASALRSSPPAHTSEPTP